MKTSEKAKAADDKMTASEAAKLEGFKSLKELALFSGKSLSSLRLYFNSNTRLWEAMLKEGMRRRDREEQLKGEV